MSCIVTFSFILKVIVGIICLMIAIKVQVWFTAGMCNSKKTMNGKTVIITGATTGIGKETALDLAMRGARMIMTYLDQREGEDIMREIMLKTGNKNVVIHQCDLSSSASVREFARKIVDTEPRVDVLINNAAIATMEATRTRDGLDKVMQVNHFGHFLLTNLLLDLIKKSSPSRIIFVASVGHRIAQFELDNMNFEKWFGPHQPYCYSKLALILTANELARKLNGTGVTVNSLHPGVVKTDIFYSFSTLHMVPAIILSRLFGKLPEVGAQTTIHLAVSDEIEGITGKYFVDCKVTVPSKMAQDEDLAKKVWERSAMLVNL